MISWIVVMPFFLAVTATFLPIGTTVVGDDTTVTAPNVRANAATVTPAEVATLPQQPITIIQQGNVSEPTPGTSGEQTNVNTGNVNTQNDDKYAATCTRVVDGIRTVQHDAEFVAWLREFANREFQFPALDVPQVASDLALGQSVEVTSTPLTTELDTVAPNNIPTSLPLDGQSAGVPNNNNNNTTEEVGTVHDDQPTETPNGNEKTEEEVLVPGAAVNNAGNHLLEGGAAVNGDNNVHVNGHVGDQLTESTDNDNDSEVSEANKRKTYTPTRMVTRGKFVRVKFE